MREVLAFALRYSDGSRVLLSEGAPPAGAIRRPGEHQVRTLARAWDEHRRGVLSVVDPLITNEVPAAQPGSPRRTFRLHPRANGGERHRAPKSLRARRCVRRKYATRPGQEELALQPDPADDCCPRCGAHPGDSCQLVDPSRCLAHDDSPVVPW
jgi:hypothetical protein